MSQFIRFYRPKENKEILININSIWKIEVEYLKRVPGSNEGYPVPLKEGLTNPDAVRRYSVFAGSEMFSTTANPNDPVMQIIEKIYNEAIKG